MLSNHDGHVTKCHCSSHLPIVDSCICSPDSRCIFLRPLHFLRGQLFDTHVCAAVCVLSMESCDMAKVNESVEGSSTAKGSKYLRYSHYHKLIRIC